MASEKNVNRFVQEVKEKVDVEEVKIQMEADESMSNLGSVGIAPQL